MNMHINLDFEISALIIMIVVMCLQLLGRKVIIDRSRLFIHVTVLEVFSILFNITGHTLLMIVGEPGFYWIRYVIELFFVCQYGITILIMTYMIAWVGKGLQQDRIARVLYFIPVLVYAEEIIRCFLTQHLIVFHPVYGYVETDEIIILNGMAVYCILYSLLYCIRNARVKSFARLTVMALLLMAGGIALLIQTQIDWAVFIDFALSIILLVMYFVAQNPADMLDTNTGVLNRQMLDEILRADIYNRRSFDLIVLALDDFKFINKNYGVTAGDMMLIQVARFLQSINPRLHVFRYGSDQFAVRVRYDVCRLEEVLEVIQERFRHPWIAQGISTMLSTTISCVTWPDDGDRFESIIDVIDYSILYAKQNGKGSVVFAKDMDLQALRKEKAIEKAIENAIERDTLEVHYQPIYNTEKQCYTSAEALVRIQDDLLGNISPDVFIPIAENNGSIVRMGNMIFEKVCKFISENNLRDTPVEYIEINVSVVQCMQENFVETLNEIMERYGVTPDQINLEVTETAAVNSLAVLQENVERLHSQGISFALDDYGSGYATIGYIHQLPFKIIKLDKLMIWDAFENERAGITLRYTVGMLKELKVHIVAEGVETEEQQTRLCDIGCDYLQGWYYSKAVPPHEFAQMIKKAS